MKSLQVTAALVLGLMLTSCSLLNSAGSMVNGMINALGRTAGSLGHLGQADTPGELLDQGPDAVATRGAMIAARGTYRGWPSAASAADTARSMASR